VCQKTIENKQQHIPGKQLYHYWQVIPWPSVVPVVSKEIKSFLTAAFCNTHDKKDS
jgi:hypothetical protein